MVFFPSRMSDVEGDEGDVFPDFTQPDEMSSIILVIEGHKLYIYKEILAAWSPVFKSMFIRDFKEKQMSEIELPGKTVDSFTELLHCMYPPIKPITGKECPQLKLLAFTAYSLICVTFLSFSYPVMSCKNVIKVKS